MNLDQADLSAQQSPIIGLPVAQYVRMSTERQCYSTENQMALIAEYAKLHEMVIVRTFRDEGKSGVTLKGRPGLLSLLSVVQKHLADFKAILVYDVSRWGRFQDVDESGYWEYLCKRAGVLIHYCAEPFPNDGSLPSVISKSLKRAMAAEFSRELSAKVFAGQCRVSRLGFHVGGSAGFGLRRLLVDREGRPKEILPPGEMKSLQSDRVVLIPGPEEEQRIVREIFHRFVEEGRSPVQIARDLNEQGIQKDNGFPWRARNVHDILVNPKYIGRAVFNRRSEKLHSPSVRNPERLWITKENAFESIASRDLFAKAAKILRRPTPDDLLDELRALLREEGRLTGPLIDTSPSSHCRCFFSKHFGSLTHVYEELTYVPARFVSSPLAAKAIASKFLNGLIGELRKRGAIIELDHRTRTVIVNGLFRLQLAVLKCSRGTPYGGPRWFRPSRKSDCDLRIIARMNEDNSRIMDYFVVPGDQPLRNNFYVQNPLLIETYRFESLDQIYRICRLERIGA
jgi:DNA invertase Pin-like site-specific DNA recombinase